ncbi:aldehyde dehydrogenase family protein [Mycoplasma sp. Pen4]|uniref:aldehyde dehydrogenase family protein n=1 Tax=Mycoplasma sp. Pen4 TaxID=640330 RepID=UPI0016542EF6|nr:aldehyde dehydrogenase family protein [Mycoplasma sp. Pen4]QNM93594.1 aldehyde dehydrogenase family protein [Mycoplasma sp. Pen4]
MKLNTPKTIKNNLKRLKRAIFDNREKIYEALYQDLGKNKIESELTEIAPVISEINLYIKKVNKWSKNKNVSTPLKLFPAKSYYAHEPLGNVLVISPWNYPFNLTMIPFVNAYGAGNKVILKPSELAPKTSLLVKEILEGIFNKEEIEVHLGGPEVVEEIFAKKLDFVMFTGSERVGKIIYKKAAEKMIPCLMELGGKTPTIVAYSADIEDTALKIVWGKMLNQGQTCVAPDYIYVHKEKKDELIEAINFAYDYISNLAETDQFDAFAKVINKNHVNRIQGLSNKITFNNEKTKMHLLLEEATWNSKSMQDEIFAPILPILTFEEVDEIVKELDEKANPLAMYVFSRNNIEIKYLVENVKCGNVMINDAVTFLSNQNLGFGGVGSSGFGKYQGYEGFKTFSHFKPVVNKRLWFKEKLRYQVFGKNDKFLKLFKKFISK